MVASELSKPRRIELILRQIESLPTLPVIATRLLSLTASDEAHAREVIQLVSSDPSLTAKVLSLCRSAEKGLRADVLTVDRAVVLLGFNAIRNAVLSVKVFEFFDNLSREHRVIRTEKHNPYVLEPQDDQDGPAGDPFDRLAFWTHSLAVAVVAESIANRHTNDTGFDAGEAFVCGLLHDIGKLALDYVLPKSFARVIELTDLNQGNIAEYERRIVGIDHHTAGKRLAEQWQLPHRLQDCIWLHGSSYESLPKLEHRRLIGLIGLSDLIVRRQHIGYSGNFLFKQDVNDLIARLELKREVVEQATSELFDELEIRGKSLGLHDEPSRELFLRSIQHANEALGRLNQTLERRSRSSAIQARILETISSFHAGACPGRTVQDVLDAVVESACSVFGRGFYGVLYPTEPSSSDNETWLISQYTQDGRPVHSQYIAAPPHSEDITKIDVTESVGLNMMGLLPWIADYLIEAQDLRHVRLLPLSCGWGTVAVLLHDRTNLPGWNHLAPLVNSWGAAIASSSQHDGARRLSEQLTEANSALAEAQDRLLRQESMARLGEMAAGAAHEMNNPLAVISGRSQLLSMTLPANSKEQKAAETIYQESHRLSDLITCLHMFADPPRPERKRTNLGSLMEQTISKFRAEHPSSKRKSYDVMLKIKGTIPDVHIQPDHIERAVTELLLNALQANPKHPINVVVQQEPGARGVIIQVVDDGDGMDRHTLDHALDPFFSAKPAGRQVGMGLPRAQQLVAAHGGTLDLRSTTGEGTTVTLSLPLDS